MLFAVLLMHSLVQAKNYSKAKIILLNGTIMEGLATFPEGPASIPILFKTDKKSEAQQINSDSIKTIIYSTDAGRVNEFDRMVGYVNGPSQKPQKQWLYVVFRGAVTLYIYEVADNSNPYRYNAHQTSWLCIREGETIATKMTSTDLKNKKNFFVDAASAYFKDDEELVKEIQSGDYTWKDVEKMVTEYNDWKKNKL